MDGKRTVCVTGASGYIGSWLVMRLLERWYHVRATVRDPGVNHQSCIKCAGNEKKVKHLLELPNASTHLTLWKADLAEESSYDDAFQGCQRVFQVAAPMGLLFHDQATKEELESATLNGLMKIMRSCSKANTLKRFLYTSTTGTIVMQPQPPLNEYTEDLWSDVEFCYDTKMHGWKYLAAKTVAEKAAWKYAEENGIDTVTVHPSLVFGHFISPCTGYSIDIAVSLYTKDKATMASSKSLNGTTAVHLDDICNAHIYLFEHPLAKGRYICSTHTFNIFDIAHSLSLKYPDRDIPTKFEGLDKSRKSIPCSSKKLMDLGFEFAHKTKGTGDLCAQTIESCREKGLL